MFFTNKQFYFPIVLWALHLLCYVDVTILPAYSIGVVTGEGFFAFLKSPNNLENITKCTIQFKGDSASIEIDLQSESEEEIKTSRDEIVSRFSKQYCGVRVLNISSKSAGKWTLQQTNTDTSILTDSVRISVYPKVDNLTTTTAVDVGNQYIVCNEPPYGKDCRIFNIRGDIHDNCMISTVIRESTQWYCAMMYRGRIEAVVQTIQINVEKEEVAGPFMKETQDRVEMSCKMNPRLIVKCVAERPDRKTIINLEEGLYNGRYTAVHTSRSGNCGLEIKKPLEDYERGIWKIYGSLATDGCIFYIGSKTDLIQSAIGDQDSVETVEVLTTGGLPFTLSCQAPFLLDHCYMRDPENTVYFPGDEFSTERKIGLCKFKELPRIPGRWICGMSGPDYESEVTRQYEVFVKSIEGEPLITKVEGSPGETVELICRSAMSSPIAWCAFVDPQGNVHLASNNFKMKSNHRISYFGQGLEAGHCGIKIRELKTSDFGTWYCRFHFGSTKSAFSIDVAEKPIGQATVLGLSVGLPILAVLLAGAIVFMVMRKRRLRRMQNTDNISLSSQESNGRL